MQSAGRGIVGGAYRSASLSSRTSSLSHQLYSVEAKHILFLWSICIGSGALLVARVS